MLLSQNAWPHVKDRLQCILPITLLVPRQSKERRLGTRHWAVVFATRSTLRSTPISIRQTDVDRLMIRTQSKGLVRVRVRVRVVAIYIQIKPFIVSKSTVVYGLKWCSEIESWSCYPEFFFLKNWRDLDFYEQKFQETEKFHVRKVKCFVRATESKMSV